MVIYQIKNKINNKLYIGQTIDFASRWKRHLRQMLQDDYPLYRAIRKYGASNFEVSILENVDSIDKLNEREIFYIKEFNTMLPLGYNCSTGGNRPIFSKESREKMSKAKKGTLPWNKNIKTGPKPEEIKIKNAQSRNKSVRRISSSGEIKIYPSLKSTALDGFRPSCVSLCCKYPFSHQSHKNFKWEYTNTKHIKQKSPKEKKFNSGQFKKGCISSTAKKVRITNLSTGEIKLYDSASIVAKELGYSHYNTVSQYCTKNKIVNNLKFEFFTSLRELNGNK